MFQENQSSHWHPHLSHHSGLDDYGVLNKLLFNESVPHSEEGVFRILGLVHLFTASGIHIHAFLNALEAMVYWSCCALGIQVVALKKIQFWIGLGVLLYLWKLQLFRAGFARPILLFLIRSFAREKGWRWRIFYPLALTFLLDCFLQIEAGRMHYYLSVGGGLWALDWCKQKFKTSGVFAQHLAMAIGSWLGIALYDLAVHHSISWATPFWSMLTLPVVSTFLFPLSLLSWVLLGHIPPLVIDLWNGFLGFCVHLVDVGVTYSVVSFPALILAFFLALVTSVILARVSKRLQLFTLVSSCIFLLVLRFSAPQFLQDDRLVQLDVKQGDALLVKKGERVEMIDIGSKKAWKVSDWLEKFAEQGVTHIDAILLSHLDEDHIGELPSLLPWISIAAVQTHAEHWRTEKGQRFVHAILKKSPTTKICAEACLSLIEVKWFRSTNHKTGNELMAGSVIPLTDHEAYFALGDGDFSQEWEYVHEFSTEIALYPKRIWKVGHHGSKFSSDSGFLKELNPSAFWISVGKHNHYHHPHPLTMERLHELQVPIYRTDEDGDLVEYISHPFFSKRS